MICFLFVGFVAYVMAVLLSSTFWSSFFTFLCIGAFVFAVICYERLKGRVEDLEKALSDIEERR